MEPTDLASCPRPHPRLAGAGPGGAALACTTALVTVTVLAAVAGTVDPALVPATAPHPTLHPTLAAAGSILLTNARVLVLPYGLLILRLDTTHWGRTLGNTLLVGVLGANAVTVGLALGRWQGRIVAYLPHLPVEWAAAGVAASVWARALATAPRNPRELAPATDRDSDRWREPAVAAAITLGLLTAAAAVEVLLTPHAT